MEVILPPSVHLLAIALLQRALLSGDEMRKRKDGSRNLLHSSPGKRAAHRLGSLATCDCYGRPIICTICSSRWVWRISGRVGWVVCSNFDSLLLLGFLVGKEGGLTQQSW